MKAAAECFRVLPRSQQAVHARHRWIRRNAHPPGSYRTRTPGRSVRLAQGFPPSGRRCCNAARHRAQHVVQVAAAFKAGLTA